MKALKQMSYVVQLGLRRMSSSVSATSSAFDLTEAQIDLQTTARDFTERHVTPTSDRYDAAQEYPRDIHREAFTVGLTPDNLLSLSDQCIVGEELATGCSSIFATMGTTATAMYPIISHGSANLKSRYIHGLMAKHPLSAAFIPLTGQITAKKSTYGHILKSQSEPSYVVNGGTASFYVAIAKTETDPNCPHEDAYTAFVVDKHWMGINVGQRVQRNGHRCTDYREVSFKNVPVPEDSIIGKVGEGFKLNQGLEARNALMDSICQVGIARRCLQLVLAELPQADCILPMAAHLEAGRLLMRRAANQLDKGDTERGNTTAQLARWSSGEAGVSNVLHASQALQMVGIDMDDNTLDKLMRDATLLKRNWIKNE